MRKGMPRAASRIPLARRCSDKADVINSPGARKKIVTRAFRARPTRVTAPGARTNTSDMRPQGYESLDSAHLSRISCPTLSWEHKDTSDMRSQAPGA